MGDWNTLHFFDDKRFQTKVVADLLDKGDLLKQYFEISYKILCLLKSLSKN